jgi:enoyl-CoA hydratase
MSTTAPLLVEISERIATITINRPDARNSLDAGLIAALVSAFRDLDADPGVDVLLLAAVDPVFCAGLDLKELGPGGNLDVSDLTKGGNPWPARTKPLIGAINGAAVTGGLELALYCDILVASERARFGDTHARVGLMPFWGLTVLLPQAVGMRTATTMSLTGNFLSAADAHRLGFVAQVVPHEELPAVARAVASDVASNDQAAVRAMLRAYRETARATGAQALDDEQQRAQEWQGRGFDADHFARRLAAVAERGRAQSAR